MKRNQQVIPDGPFGRAAMAYAENRFHPMPLRGKIPFEKEWQKLEFAVASVARYRTHNIGLRMGLQPSGHNLFAIDADDVVRWEAIAEVHGCPDTVTAATGSGKRHYLFNAPLDVEIKTTQDCPAPDIDVRGLSGQIAVESSIHPKTGRQYHWLDIEIDNLRPADCAMAPAWLIEMVRRPTAEEQRLIAEGFSPAPDDYSPAQWSRDLYDLAYVDPRCSRDVWIRMGMALHWTGHSDAFEIWDRWSRGDLWFDGPLVVEHYPQRGMTELARQWRSFKR